ncbi:primase C-terminal domain-containing protein, partial [Arthrospira platensis SPKY1]|nr:primase C-terminal domain-containing protein [Arthrospira platensis SPKY1]
DLDGLASWLDLTQYNDRRKNLPDYGLGRNCTLFDRLRHWAYKAIRQGWPSYERWLMAVEQRAHAYNDFSTPLSSNEVDHIAKSVAKFTHKNFSPSLFSAWQSAQGAKGGLAKGKAYAEKREKALKMLELGMKRKEIADILQISE